MNAQVLIVFAEIANLAALNALHLLNVLFAEVGTFWMSAINVPFVTHFVLAVKRLENVSRVSGDII